MRLMGRHLLLVARLGYTPTMVVYGAVWGLDRVARVLRNAVQCLLVLLPSYR